MDGTYNQIFNARRSTQESEEERFDDIQFILWMESLPHKLNFSSQLFNINTFAAKEKFWTSLEDELFACIMQNKYFPVACFSSFSVPVGEVNVASFVLRIESSALAS